MAPAHAAGSRRRPARVLARRRAHSRGPLPAVPVAGERTEGLAGEAGKLRQPGGEGRTIRGKQGVLTATFARVRDGEVRGMNPQDPVLVRPPSLCLPDPSLLQAGGVFIPRGRGHTENNLPFPRRPQAARLGCLSLSQFGAIFLPRAPPSLE